MSFHSGVMFTLYYTCTYSSGISGQFCNKTKTPGRGVKYTPIWYKISFKEKETVKQSYLSIGSLASLFNSKFFVSTCLVAPETVCTDLTR